MTDREKWVYITNVIWLMGKWVVEGSSKEAQVWADRANAESWPETKYGFTRHLANNGDTIVISNGRLMRAMVTDDG